jgi:hypothetical protein
VLAPATLAALPSTRAIPDRDVFNVVHLFAPFSGDDVGIGEIDAVFEADFVASANLECLDTVPFTLERSPKSFPCVYRKRLTMHARLLPATP